MSDIVDNANDQAAMLLRHTLEAQRRQHGEPEGDWRVLSAHRCQDADCGERIPPARRQALPGVQFCVTCAELRERLKGQFNVTGYQS